MEIRKMKRTRTLADQKKTMDRVWRVMAQADRKFAKAIKPRGEKNRDLEASLLNERDCRPHFKLNKYA